MARRTAARAVLRRARAGLLCAALAFAAACNKLPDLALEHLKQGDAALADGRYGQALAAYAHAHELAPHEPRVQQAQMRARVYLMADSPARVGPDALEDVAYEAQLLLKTDRRDEAVCLAALGNILLRRGDYEGAKAKLAEAVKADPSSAIAHSALGTLLMSRRDGYTEAKIELDLALKHKPDAVGALVGIGQIKLAEGDAAGAVERFEAALRRGDDLAVRLALGNARLQQGKHAEAAEQFQHVVQLDPKNGDALSLLGQALLGAGRLDEAEGALRAAMQLRPQEATSIALGYTLARLRKSDQALGVFTQVLAQNAAAAPALYGAGVASEDIGRTDQALDYYRRVLALPAEGSQKQLVAELAQQAQSRVAVLSALPATSASASAMRAAPSAPPPR